MRLLVIALAVPLIAVSLVTVSGCTDDKKSSDTTAAANQTPTECVAGKTVTTIEGLSADGSHPVQQAWVEHDVPQCGYCQSGQIMSAASLLSKKTQPTDADIDEAMRGNICRCGTYGHIRGAIHRAAELKAQGGKA